MLNIKENIEDRLDYGYRRVRGNISMKDFLYTIVEYISEFHALFLKLNDNFEYQFSDKELHFLIIGFLGMGLIFVIYPLFKWLAKHNHIMTIAGIYVFTLIIVITFAIEIGQKIGGTGTMDFADIVFGVVGFLFMFAVFGIVRGIWHGLRRLLKR